MKIDTYRATIDKIKVSDDKLSETSGMILDYDLTRAKAIKKNIRIYKWIARAASFILVILLSMTIIQTIHIKHNEPRRLTIEDFYLSGLKTGTQPHLSELSKKIKAPQNSKITGPMHYDGRNYGGLIISHDYYELRNHIGRDGPYYVGINTITIKANGTNIVHPLNIKIGSDFNTVMSKMTFDTDASIVKSIKQGNVLYITGEENSKESAYIEWLSYKHLYKVVCYFNVNGNKDYKTDAMIEFVFDSNENKLNSINYVYRDTILGPPKEDFIYEECFGDLYVVMYSGDNFKNEVNRVFPDEKIDWQEITNEDGSTRISYSNKRVSFLYSQKSNKTPQYMGIKILSNEHKYYLPAKIEISDSFETVMTKFNAPDKDLKSVLGVDDITKWDGEQKELFSNSTRDSIYITRDEKLIPWDEAIIKDNYFALTYLNETNYMLFNFNSNQKLISVDFINFNIHFNG